MKKLAALFLAAAACGPGLVEFPTIAQGTGGGVPGSPANCAAIPGAVYCGNATCDTLGVSHCGLNNGICEACPATYSCSAGACVPPTTCAPGLVVCASGCCTANQVAAGGNTSCTIVGQGGANAVYCWGANESGQAGPAAVGTSTSVPSEIAALRGASAIALGSAHGCAIVGPSVLCWGLNDRGQLGSGAKVSLSVDPIKVPEGEGATAIAAGDHHSCAITPAGAVCWGAIQGTFPAQGATKIVAGGGHACAMLTSSVLCWGLNDVGQLGNGTQNDSATAVTPQLTNIGSVLDLTAGFHHTCAVVAGPNVDKTNTVRCWGGNESAQIDSSHLNRLTPTNVQPFGNSLGTAEVDGGRAHTCARKSNTDIICFGDNSFGQLSFPVVAPGSLAAGADHSCVLDTSNLLHCWGRNASSELGPFGP